jgi:hypothetical protein
VLLIKLLDCLTFDLVVIRERKPLGLAEVEREETRYLEE